jgi:hypothetical protein
MSYPRFVSLMNQQLHKDGLPPMTDEQARVEYQQFRKEQR